MDLTIVVPCFNEALRIDACVEAVARWKDAHADVRCEALFVDDGSTDGTRDRLRAWTARRDDVRLLALDAHAGKGEAVRRGVLEARGDVVVFLDADLAVDVGHVDDVLPALRDGVDVAVGCRHLPGARVEREQAPVRRSLGRGYLQLSRWLLGLRVADVTCGFKGFRRGVAHRLFAASRCRGWGFDAEVLHLAARDRFVVREVPVVWRDGAGSRVRLPADAWASLRDLLAVRWRSLRGAYGPPRARLDRVPAAEGRGAR